MTPEDFAKIKDDGLEKNPPEFYFEELGLDPMDEQWEKVDQPMGEEEACRDYGYHQMEITRGKFGRLSKIREELDEATDAEHQGNRIMLLQELSDLYGALEGYLKEEFPNFNMSDLKKMSDATKRAFKLGRRNAQD